MNFIEKTIMDLARDHNYRYFTALIARMNLVGINNTIKEIHEYNKKYTLLPRKIGKRGDLKYGLFVLYNYFKIIYVFPKISRDRLMDYFPTRFQQFFLFDLDPKEEKLITFNKLLFYKKLTVEKIAHPRTFGYIKNGEIYNFDDKLFSKKDIELLPNKLFVKPYEANGGVDAQIIYKEDLYSLKGDLLFQELLTNHHDINILSGSYAFNTVRIITYFDKKGTFQILSAIFRISKGKIIDNWGKGSINVQIDIKTGRLKGVGITKYRESFTNYPNTGILFDGFQLPMWNEFTALVTAASYAFINLKLIAWDIGFSESGPIIVEANSGCDFFHAQLFEPYFQTKLIQDLITTNN